MNVEDYVGEVLGQRGHPNSFPKELVLPDDLVVGFSALFVAGEREAREYGCNLIYEESRNELSRSQRYVGDMNSCPIRTMMHWENCADVHCHPAASIGDVDGYSPHSMEDFLSFSEQTHKPLFIRFVVSHDRIFAAVYRKGHTLYDAQGIDELRGRLAFEIGQYFKTHCPAGDEERLEAIMKEQEKARLTGEDVNDAASRVVIGYKRRTPGLGEFTAEATTRACKQVAARYRFGFYARSGTYTLARVD